MTGYRMRTLIAKSLQTRCKAIQNAIKRYNTAAASLEPPAPPLEWSRVSHYGFLEEFTLLKETRQDIRSKQWAQPAVRETMYLMQRVERAREEIERCNVELRRLNTAITDETAQLRSVLDHLRDNHNVMYRPVDEFCQRRFRINEQVTSHIQQAFMLEGFTGDPSIGQRKGTSAAVDRADRTSRTPGMPGQRMMGAGEDDDDDADVSDDESGNTVAGVIDFISNL